MTREVLEYKCNNPVIRALFFDTFAFCPACVNKINNDLHATHLYYGVVPPTRSY